MSIYQNGWTRESMLKQIEEKNGFKICSDKEHIKCLYRNDDGRACLVGAFIPDEKYNPAFEDETADYLLKENVDLSRFMPLDNMLMRELQNIHDTHIRYCTTSLKERIINKLDEWENEK